MGGTILAGNHLHNKSISMKENEQFEPAKNFSDSQGANAEHKKDNAVNKTEQAEEHFTAGNETPEIATNDGSVIETLDTAFHGTQGWSEGENISGSNRADYYEARSNGKSDAEEELDEIRNRNKQSSS